MPATLIVSANGTLARMFMQSVGCPMLDEIHDIACGGAGDQEPQRLARAVAGYLRQAHEAEAFQRLVLMGSPDFLRALRSRLAPPLDALVAAQIDGDYTTLGPEQLLDRLEAPPGS